MPIDFCPIASGSSGNSVFISVGGTKILIDAGLSGVRIEKGLRALGVDCGAVDAVFITHEHSDHTMGAYILSRRFDIPIYATPGTWQALERNRNMGTIAKQNKRFVYADEDMIFGDAVIRPFPISHDANEPVGYSVYAGGKKVTVTTDIGCVTDGLKENIMNSDVLLIESNHDVDMLMNGSYAYPLKKRVMSDTGHLSNVNCGKLLAEIMCGRLKHIYLGHLSLENNRPSLAYETVHAILEANGIEVGGEKGLYLAERNGLSRMVSV
jgi:phosphoribosyl 1,2-cyclic phosphodiesterase